jgi:PAS domain S-box-containing protein
MTTIARTTAAPLRGPLDGVTVRRPGLAVLGLFFASYVLACWLGQGLKLVPGVSITFWPSAGIFVAALVLSAPRTWAWWIVAAGAAELACNALWFRNPVPFALVYFFANAAEALAAAGVIRWLAGPGFRLESLRDVGALILCAIVAPMVGATIIATTDALLGKHAFLTAWTLVWLGDGSGLLVSLPLAIVAAGVWRDRRRIPPARALEALGIGVVLAIVAALSLRGDLPTLAVAIPVMLWAGARFQLRGASVAIALVTLMVAAFTAGGRGEFAADPGFEQHRIVLLKTFLAVSSMSTLLVAAISQQHRAALDRLRAANADLDARVAERTGSLQESELRFRLFIENAPAAIAMFDRDMRYLAVSRRWRVEYGLQRAEDVIGRSHYDLFPRMPRAWREAHQRGLAGEVVSSEGDAVRGADGLVRHIRWEVRPWRYAGGQVGGILIAAEDITLRTESERELRMHREQLQHLVDERTEALEKTHLQLRLAERMATLGTLAAGLAHDMGNMLLPMRAHLDALAAIAEQRGQPSESVEALRRSTEYLRNLAAGLRSLSLDPENAAHSSERTSLAHWWNEVSGLLKAVLPRGVTLIPPDARAVPDVLVPSHSLTQVVLNLVQNAGDAVRNTPGGVIRVETSVHDGHVRLVVRDNGPGMTPEVASRCMEPFFTTKAPQRGTGLGLALVHDIMRRSGGTVEVQTAPGQGAAFVLTLPPATVQMTQPAFTVAISLTDPRARALVRAILPRTAVEVSIPSPDAHPEADLWVVDAKAPTEPVARFTQESPRRRVVALNDVKPGSIRAEITRAMSGLGAV